MISNRPAGYLFLQADRDRLKRRRIRILDFYLQQEYLEVLAEALQTALGYLNAAQSYDYIDMIAPLSCASSLQDAGFVATKANRFWLMTQAVEIAADTEWLMSLVDKDNAFRGCDAIP
jgi:hypothetical protein